MVFCILAGALVFGCNKQVDKTNKETPSTEIAAEQDLLQRVHKFLSIVNGIPFEEMSYDKKEKQFIAPKYKYTISFEEAKSRYDEANVYKITYEKD
ncbi:hypothetical protein GCM10027516_07140 [Niabella aquatica]